MKMLIAPKIQTYYVSNYKVILYTFNAEMQKWIKKLYK